MTDRPDDQTDEEARALVRRIFARPSSGRGLFATSENTDTEDEAR